MSLKQSTLTVKAWGLPRFVDEEFERLHRTQGVENAWTALYRCHGRASPQRVEGNFAVAIAEDTGHVFLAVDRFAICTLCYRVENGKLLFAERADELADESVSLSPQSVFNYLYFHCIPSPDTIFEGVFRLSAGCCAVFDKGVVSSAKYWQPGFSPNRGRNFEQSREEFLSLLKGAVSASVRPGRNACFLSGGTDSSTVAGMIREVSGNSAESFSIGFSADGYDEMEYARIAAKHFGTKHHEYYVTPEDLVSKIPDVAAYYDQPFGNSSAVPAFFCAQMARSAGFDRILAGDGGDELFGGNTRYAKQKVFGWYHLFPRAMRRGLIEPALDLPGVANIPLLSKVRSYSSQARVPMPDRIQSYNLIQRLGIDTVLSAGFISQVDLDDPIVQQRNVWTELAASSELNRQLAFDWRYTLAENDLRKVTGTAHMAGVQVAFPFLDDKLVEFSATLPDSYKLNGLKLRWFFKESLRGFLPDAILSKKKHGFGLPFGVWAVSHSALRDLAESSVRSLAKRGLLNQQFVDLLFSKHLVEHPGYYGEMVWIAMMLEQWLQAFEARKHRAPIGFA